MNFFPSSETNFYLSRSIWLRGEGSEDCWLYRPADGLKCCLGQIAEQVGYSSEQICQRANIGALCRLTELYLFPESFWDTDRNWSADWITEVMLINDNPKLSDFNRESQLQELFARYGLTLSFGD